MGFSVFAAEGAEVQELVLDAKRAGTLDSPSMNELVRRYEGLVKREVAKMDRPTSMTHDLINGGRWGVVQAVLHHDGRTAGFTSYLVRYIRGEAERAFERQASRDVTLPEEEFPVVHSQIGQPDRSESDIQFESLTHSQNLLVLARYRDDKTLLEIAVGEGSSVSAISQRLRTIQRKLAADYLAA